MKKHFFTSLSLKMSLNLCIQYLLNMLGDFLTSFALFRLCIKELVAILTYNSFMFLSLDVILLCTINDNYCILDL